MRHGLRVLIGVLIAVCMLVVSGAHAARRGLPGHPEGTVLSVNANQTNNWAGYNQGTLEKGLKTFSHVAGDWFEPTVTQHVKNQVESSAIWVGVGGGCLESSCLLTDPTLIQAGTSQDVAANGTVTHSAWWEVIPVPSLNIVSVSVRAGDHMHVDIAATVP